MVNLRDKQKSSSKIQSRYKKSRQKPIIYLTLLLLVVMMQFRPQGALGWNSTLPYRLPGPVKKAIAQNKRKRLSQEG